MYSVREWDPGCAGDYQLLCRLGTGGMGEVFLGRASDNHLAAVKVVHEAFAGDPEFRARFRREVAAARRVSGPWAASVIDADPDARQPWLATEYVVGPTLAAAVAEHGVLPEPTIKMVAARLAQALVAIHSAGLVHRDLKPSNVLLAGDGPRVIDFGIARALDTTNVTLTGRVVGTPAFMAPEQVTESEVGSAADVFCLGSLLYFAATGGSPFGDASTVATLRRVVAAEPDLAPLSPGVRDVVGRCLVKESSERATAGQLVAMLLEDVPTLAGGSWLPPAFATLVELEKSALEHTLVEHPAAPPSEARSEAAAEADVMLMMAEPLGDRDPRQIGPYVLLGRLGAGGMGQVYLGRGADGHQVAVKVVHPGLAHDEQFRARFRREVSAARRVEHPCVARVLDADPDARHPWLATECVPGSSLEQAVTGTRPLPERSVRVMAASLFDALATIHDNGVLHRDIKPSNILLGPDRPKLIDFGVARAAESTQITGTGMLLGSPAFMSPEQANGDEVGAASDVYSLAAVLVFASTGVGPFGEGSPAALLLRATETTPNLDAVPDSVRPMLELCLAADPAARPTASVLAAALAAGTADAAGTQGDSASGWLPPPMAESAPPPATPPAGARPEMANWLVAAAMIAVVVVTATAIITAINVSDGAGSTTESSVTASATATAPSPELVSLNIGASSSVQDVAFSPDSRRAYFAHSYGVEVVDTSTNQVITSIKLDEPTAVAVTPDGAHVYIGLSSGDSGDVVVVDTATHATIATISADRVGWGAAEISITPAGRRAFVLNGSAISVIDTASHSVTRTIDVTPPQSWNYPHSMLMRADGGQLYLLTDDRANTVGLDPGIAVVNTDDYSVSFWPRGFEDIALAPDSATVYGLGSSKVDVLDTAGLPKTFPLQLSQEIGPRVMAVAPDGRHLFILGGRSLVVVDATTANVVDTIPFFRVDLSGPAVHVSPDGRQIYVVGRDDEQFAVIDATKYN